MGSKNSQPRRRETSTDSGGGEPQTGNDQLTFGIRVRARTHTENDVEARSDARLEELLEAGGNLGKSISQELTAKYARAMDRITENGPIPVKEAKPAARYLADVRDWAASKYWDELTGHEWAPFIVYDGMLDRREGVWREPTSS